MLKIIQYIIFMMLKIKEQYNKYLKNFKYLLFVISSGTQENVTIESIITSFKIANFILWKTFFNLRFCLELGLNTFFNYITEHYLLVSVLKPFLNILIISILLVIVPVLLTVALLTLVERKTMAALQRRRGPNIIGFFGLLQPFADGLKLLTKEFNIPGRSYDYMVITTPMMSLMFTCSCFSLVPLSTSFIYYTTNSISALYIMAISSLNIYSIIMAGWSSKSAYAFLGSLRASAQFISYEVSMTLNIMGVFLVSGSFSLTEIVYVQEQTISNIFVLFPVFLLYFIGVLSETNRTPYDLAEAESELVAGYGVEFSAVGFAFFFIAEYASIILYCLLIINLFFGGINTVILNTLDFLYKIVFTTDKSFPTFLINYGKALFEDISNIYDCVLCKICGDGRNSLTSLCDRASNTHIRIYHPWKDYIPQEDIECITKDFSYKISCEKFLYSFINNYVIEPFSKPFVVLMAIFDCLLFGFKVFLLLYLFIHVRATYARYRFDQLMKLNWKNLLIISLVVDLYIAIILLINI